MGSERKIVAAKAGGYFFLAPDSGILAPVLKEHPPDLLVSVENSEYFLKEVSRTFHGRDIFAPVAARISLGLDLRKLGPELREITELCIPSPTVAADGRIRGEVIRKDGFGNLVTNIPAQSLPSESLRVHIRGKLIEGLADSYADAAEGELLAIIGSFGTIEISARNAGAAELLGAGRGEPVEVDFE